MSETRGVEWLQMSHEDFAQELGNVYSHEGDLPRLEAIAQVRAALEAERNAIAQRGTARWTRALVIVTGFLVAMTAWFSFRAKSAQEDTLHELRRQNCLAEIQLLGLVYQDVRIPAGDVEKAGQALQRDIDKCR